jgi:protein gp37
MSDNSAIEWTDSTWNPVTGCTEVSPGCDHCYAKTFAERWRGSPGHHFENGFDVTLRPERIRQPLGWRKPRKVFVNSMSDLFHEAIPDEFIAKVFAVMAATPQHTYQILTKRHGRMRSLLNSEAHAERVATECAQLWEVDRVAPFRGPLPNVWLGVSVEDQKRADLRIPALMETPAAVRFLSCEPLLGPVDLTQVAPGLRYSNSGFTALRGNPRIHWVIVGGESGNGARPMDPEWVRSLRDQCVAAEVPYFMKQWGGRNKKATGRELDGRTWDEFPETVLAAT